MLRDAHTLKNTLRLGSCLHPDGVDGALVQAHVFTGIRTMPVATGTLTFYETGFTFVTSSFHPIVVSFESDVDSHAVAGIACTPGIITGCGMTCFRSTSR